MSQNWVALLGSPRSSCDQHTLSYTPSVRNPAHTNFFSCYLFTLLYPFLFSTGSKCWLHLQHQHWMRRSVSVGTVLSMPEHRPVVFQDSIYPHIRAFYTCDRCVDSILAEVHSRISNFCCYVELASGSCRSVVYHDAALEILVLKPCVIWQFMAVALWGMLSLKHWRTYAPCLQRVSPRTVQLTRRWWDKDVQFARTFWLGPAFCVKKPIRIFVVRKCQHVNDNQE